jgi:hypothetical protein
MMHTEVECMVAAARLGLKFNGMQERPRGPAVPLFTDSLETGTTFAQRPGETLQEALERARARFVAKER